MSKHLEQAMDANLALKEDNANLERLLKEWIEYAKSLHNAPHLVHGNLKLIEIAVDDQIKAQKGEPSSQMKVETVEQFATHLSFMVKSPIKYLEEKFGCE